jgi:UDP-N-acetylmuramoyl-tripeptide--D-alanyl-D-alanine ligase
MRELGEGSAALHAGLATPLIAANVSAAILSGGEMSHLAAELKRRNAQIRIEHVSGPGEAAERVKNSLAPGDAVLIKGSNASGMSRVGAALREMSAGAGGPQKATGAKDAV